MEEVSSEVISLGNPFQNTTLAKPLYEADTSVFITHKEELPGKPLDLQLPPGNMVYYRIQIAAAVKPITSFGQFNKLSDLIDLYGLSVDKAGIHFKYRIGNFDSREAALPVWQNIRNRGFRDCFIVTVD